MQKIMVLREEIQLVPSFYVMVNSKYSIYAMPCIVVCLPFDEDSVEMFN